MVKRGERRVRSARAHSKHGAIVHPKRGGFFRKELHEIQSAEAFIQQEEKVVEKEVGKEVRFLLSPQEFHVVTFIASLLVLALLFASTSLIFYSVATIAALLFAHFMKKHHRPHDFLAILWIFFLPICITIVLFPDSLAWLILTVCIVSFISAVIMYYYHKKEHALLKVMWQTTYSKVIAITLAVILASLLPDLILPDTFLSVFELIFIYVLPVSFIFFFTSKFFYVYFFERKHIWSDMQKSLRHTMIYTLVFIILLMSIYTLFAASFYNARYEKYSSDLDKALLDVSAVEKTLLSLPKGIAELRVAKDLVDFASALSSNISSEKSVVMDRALAFSDILDDYYFEMLRQDSINGLRFAVLEGESLDAKVDILRMHDELSGILSKNSSFPDGSGKIEDYAGYLESSIGDRFVYYSRDESALDLLDKLNSFDAYSDFEDSGFFFWFGESIGSDFIYHSDSIFARQISFVIRHMKPFREIARLVINAEVFIALERSSGSVIEHMYGAKDSDTLPMSEAIRYSMIRSSLDKEQVILRDIGKVDFRSD